MAVNGDVLAAMVPQLGLLLPGLDEKGRRLVIRAGHLVYVVTTPPLPIPGHNGREICHGVCQVVMVYAKSSRVVLV